MRRFSETTKHLLFHMGVRIGCRPMAYRKGSHVQPSRPIPHRSRPLRKKTTRYHSACPVAAKCPSADQRILAPSETHTEKSGPNLTSDTRRPVKNALRCRKHQALYATIRICIALLFKTLLTGCEMVGCQCLPEEALRRNPACSKIIRQQPEASLRSA